MSKEKDRWVAANTLIGQYGAAERTWERERENIGAESFYDAKRELDRTYDALLAALIERQPTVEVRTVIKQPRANVDRRTDRTRAAEKWRTYWQRKRWHLAGYKTCDKCDTAWYGDIDRCPSCQDREQSSHAQHSESPSFPECKRLTHEPK